MFPEVGMGGSSPLKDFVYNHNPSHANILHCYYIVNTIYLKPLIILWIKVKSIMLKIKLPGII